MSSPSRTVVQAHRALAAAGQGDLVWGHAAVRDPDGRGVWTKAAGWGFEEITEERVLLVSPEGEVLAGTGTRHVEYAIHTEVLRARRDVGAVVHTHPGAATAFAALGVPLRALDHDGVLFSEPDVPRFPGTGGLIRTAELGAAVAAALGDARAVLLPRHGVVTVGATAAEAVMHAVLLDRACHTQLRAMAAGELRGWSDAAECAAKRTECWNPTQIDAGWQYLLRAAGLHTDPPEETP